MPGPESPLEEQGNALDDLRRRNMLALIKHTAAQIKRRLDDPDDLTRDLVEQLMSRTDPLVDELTRNAPTEASEPVPDEQREN